MSVLNYSACQILTTLLFKHIFKDLSSFFFLPDVRLLSGYLIIKAFLLQMLNLLYICLVIQEDHGRFEPKG